MSPPGSPPGLDVLGIGTAVRDITVRLDPFPSPDSKVRAAEMAESGGGPVPTALVTIARLGGTAAWAGPLGDDEAAALIERSLAEENVDTRGAVRRPGAASPASVILVEPGGGRRVCEWRQADQAFTPEDLAPAAVLLQSCRALLADGRLPQAQEAAAGQVRSRGGMVVLDCGHPRPGADLLFPLTDTAVLSHSYARSVEGPGFDPAAFVRKMSGWIAPGGRRLAGLTLGEEGCILSEGGADPVTVPSIRIESVPVVDTTGAGDVFHGAFILELLRGTPAPDAARFACAAAAFSCTGLTGRAPLPREAEIRRAAAAGRI